MRYDLRRKAGGRAQQNHRCGNDSRFGVIVGGGLRSSHVAQRMLRAKEFKPSKLETIFWQGSETANTSRKYSTGVMEPRRQSSKSIRLLFPLFCFGLVAGLSFSTLEREWLGMAVVFAALAVYLAWRKLRVDFEDIDLPGSSHPKENMIHRERVGKEGER
jgi:hypothetical protein